jgi:predicted metal-dependent HD superfamily phosphohydrolase
MSAIVLDKTRWIELWLSLGAEPPAVGFELLACLHAEPHRWYHTAKHIAACLRWFDTYKHIAKDPATVELAIWLHDAIYIPLRTDNEVRSADLAEEMLIKAGLPDRVERVRALIMATQHSTAVGPDDAGLLTDIDLSVLGSPWPLYLTYSRAVRKEFSAVPDQQFVAGRIAVLKHFLAQPTIYVHRETQLAWELQARENLESEIRKLHEHGST